MSSILVLICDDDENLLKISQKYITKLDDGIKVYTVSSGKQALQEMKRTSFDIIVCDYQMPNMNGLEVLKKLRRQDNSIPFIMFTGHSREQIAIEALNLGATNYLTKSGHPKSMYTELVHLIRRAVEHDRIEKALIASERDKSIILDGISDMVTFYEYPSMKIIWANRSSIESSLTKQEEFIGEVCYEKWHNRDVPCQDCPTIKSAIDSEIQIGSRRTPDERSWIITCYPITNEDGNVSGIVEVGRDITEQKMAKERLRESESQLRRLIEHLGYPLHVINQDFEIILVNNAYYEWIGKYNLSTDVIGKNLFVMFPFLLDKVKDEYDTVFETGEIVITQETNLFMGEQVYTETTKIPILSEGVVTQVLSVFRDVTSEVVSLEKLKKSEERYRSLVEASPDAVIRLDTEGIIQQANKQVLELVGAERIEDVIGSHYTDWLSEKELTSAENEFAKMMRGDADIQHQYKLTGSDGRTKIVESHAALLEDEEGAYIGILAIIRDISQRKSIEEEIRISEKRLRSLAENIDSVIWLSDPDDPSKIVYLSPGFEKIWDIPVERALESPKIFLDSIHPDDKEEVEKALRKFLETKHEYNLEYRILTNNNDVKWIWAKGFFILDPDGNKHQFGGVAQDITKRVKDRMELERAYKQFDRLFESSIDGITFSDLDGILLKVNPAFAKLLGYSNDELIGRNFIDFTVEKYHEENRRILEKLSLNSGVYNFEKEYYRKDGSRATVSLSTWLHTDEGKKIGYWAVIRDISEQKELVKKLEESREQYRKERERLSELAHYMRHDLSALLHNIEGFCEIIQDTNELQYIDRIKENTRQMRIVFDRSVELADAGLVIGNLQKTDLDELVREIVFRAVSETVQVEIKNLPVIECDREKIVQVFTNILINAIQHGKAQKIKISSIETDNEIQILIMNDGDAIPEDIRRKIFKDNFFLKSTKGLGMQIVRRIIEAHRWSISLDTGEPVTFRISIPTR
ncbi:MAG: putative Histidine kinase [Candidatus Thorarchaeota archaeon]|nr:MAG: putative Histidine kinase [Candidatus Thorarchaeota archaeon]